MWCGRKCWWIEGRCVERWVCCWGRGWGFCGENWKIVSFFRLEGWIIVSNRGSVIWLLCDCKEGGGCI